MSGLIRLAKFFAISPEEGAKTMVYLASSPEVAGTTGQYFYKCHVAQASLAARDDKAARSEQMLRNFKFFDAPVGLFITFSRRMSVGTFMDLGMFIENILIGARGEGLHPCGQVAWCSHHQMIREELGIDQDELLACGISVGYAVEDAPENVWHTDRASIDEWVTFFEE